MKNRSPTDLAAEKLQQRIAEITVVIAGPIIAVSVCDHFYHQMVGAKDGALTMHDDLFSFYLLNGILGCVGIIALILSMATARHLFQMHLKRLKSRKG